MKYARNKRIQANCMSTIISIFLLPQRSYCIVSTYAPEVHNNIHCAVHTLFQRVQCLHSK